MIVLIVAVQPIAKEQSLADLAKKEEERRKSAPSSKVYTNGDLDKSKSDASGSETLKGLVNPKTPATQSDGSGPQPSGAGTALPTKQVKSQGDIVREQILATLTKRIEATGQLFDEAAKNYDRYTAACDDKVTGVSTPKGVPLDSIVIGGTAARVAQGELLPPGTGSGPIANETTPQCRILWNDIINQTATVDRELKDIEETARRAGIYPGVIRELRAKNRLIW